MRILEKIKNIRHKESGIRQFCIQAIRFKKFLENARVLLDLFHDGQEKMQEEYIFDRHYVVSLIDSVIERLGMMVYDASVLAPNRGERLYDQYDKHKLAAGNLISTGGMAGQDKNSGDHAAEKALAAEPEYRLLSDVLRWFDGKDTPAEPTVMGFMKQAFFHVLQFHATGESISNDIIKHPAICEISDIPASDLDIYIVDLWKDSLKLPASRRSIHDFNSVPLRHLLMDAGAKSEKTDSTSDDISWVAAVSEYQLSLNALKPGFRFRLETLASGYEQSDFIFIFADTGVGLKRILPAGFHIETTDFGQLAWNLDVSTKTIEDSLMIIGRNLLN